CATFRSPPHCWCVSIFCHGVRADYGPPIAAARPLICGAGRLRASHSCCQAPNLPWAPVPTPHAAARPVICHGPLLSLVGIFRSFRCSFSCYSSSRIPSAVFLGIRFQETTVCEHAPDGAEAERPP
ncbi:unnamed protein product, partial [Staurois parvus]